MNGKICPYCNKKVVDLISASKCTGCRSFYHESCAKRTRMREDNAYMKCCGDDGNVNKKQSDGLSNRITSKDESNSSSEKNNSKESNMLTKDDLKQLFAQIKSEINESVSKLQDKIEDNILRVVNEIKTNLLDQVKIINENVSKLEERMVNQDMKIEEVHEKVDAIEIDLQQVNEREGQDEKMIVEIRERMMKEKNVIFYEIENDLSNEKDNEIVKQILSNTEIECESIKTIRFGKKEEGRTRPLRVTFNSVEDANWVLRNQRRIDEKLKCSNDKTKMQREYSAKIKEQFEKRKQNGEDDIRLKYIKGQLCIVYSRMRNRSL